jgi:hypothetical protein
MLLTTGCASTPEAESLARKDDLGTAPITHVVLVQLKDPTRIGELVADCDRALPGIPGVAAYSCGVPLDMGRSNVTKDYDVGIYVGFADASAYRGYLDDPRHLALVEEWRDGWKAVRIFDVLAGDPAAVQAVTASRTAPPPAEVPAPKPAAPAPAAAPASTPAPAAPASAAPASSAPTSAAPASAAPPSAAPAAPPRAAPPAAGAAAPAAPKR